MGLLDIFSKITLDGSQFQAGLKSADRGVTQFAGSLRNKVGAALGAAFGVNALLRIGKQAIASGHTITQLAERFSITTDEVQLLQQEAEKTGVTFESLVKDAEQLEKTLGRLSGGEAIFSRQAVAQLEDAHQKIKAFNDALAVEQAKSIEAPSHFFKNIARTFGLMRPEAPEAGLTQRQDAFLQMDSARKRAKVIELTEQAALISLEKELLGLKNDALTKEEKLAKLLAQRAALMEKRASDPNERKTVLENEIATAKLDAAIAALRGKETASITKSGPTNELSPMTDSLRWHCWA